MKIFCATKSRARTSTYGHKPPRLSTTTSTCFHRRTRPVRHPWASVDSHGCRKPRWLPQETLPDPRAVRGRDLTPRLPARVIGGMRCHPMPLAAMQSPQLLAFVPACSGEHLLAGCDAGADDGSSPPARGALRARRVRHDVGGIIPACAGSTSGTASPTRCRRDHPRLRGEHPCDGGVMDVVTGSSPPARGALVPARHQRELHGISPAWRGEHSSPVGVRRPSDGSSPPARGAHHS